MLECFFLFGECDGSSNFSHLTASIIPGAWIIESTARNKRLHHGPGGGVKLSIEGKDMVSRYRKRAME